MSEISRAWDVASEAAMRTRAVVAIVLVLLPVGLNAQRLPRIGRRGPAQPAPLGPQPPEIARQVAYTRSHVSIESYPLITYSQSPGVNGDVFAKRTSFGAGTRADYRVMRRLSVTLDMTSSLPNGSTNTETAELGLRLRPERSDRTVYPFVDVRGGYVHTYDTYLRPFDVIDGFGGISRAGYGARYSQGFGGVAGVGMEYALTTRFSLTTAAYGLRSGMTAYRASGVAPTNAHYMMTSYRLMLGVRYNPVHMITAIETESQH
jgi:hypothetical protein